MAHGKTERGTGGMAACVALLWASAAAADKQPLSDAELDAIKAGTAGSNAEELLTFEVVKRTRSGKTIAADGELKVVESLQSASWGRRALRPPRAQLSPPRWPVCPCSRKPACPCRPRSGRTRE